MAHILTPEGGIFLGESGASALYFGAARHALAECLEMGVHIVAVEPGLEFLERDQRVGGAGAGHAVVEFLVVEGEFEGVAYQVDAPTVKFLWSDTVFVGIGFSDEQKGFCDVTCRG